MSGAGPFAWIVPLADVPPAGRKIARDLTAEECAKLAAHAGIEAVTTLSAHGEITHWSAGFKAEIGFKADVVQLCVVTLEPVSEHVVGEFSRRYLPGLDEAEVPAIDVGPDDEDPPEPLQGDTIDLGLALTEELILALDPYPRAPGATIPAEARADAADPSPFAVLERLKPKP